MIASEERSTGPAEFTWDKKRVLITGHTGFKGSWLALWLAQRGARVIGYALPPPSEPSLFELANVDQRIVSVQSDVRSLSQLQYAISEHNPEIVFHLAAQSIVGYSYEHPVETFETNVLGTVNVLEAVRKADCVRAVVVVTSDKCYENKEWTWGYRETDSLGGYDPYSASKGCAELVTASYRRAYYSNGEESGGRHSLPPVASVRAGNVIGGGDWAQDRLVPDVMRGILTGGSVELRNPDAVRPWQHVLDPLSGYLLVAERLWRFGHEYAEAWNFGPTDLDLYTVGEVVDNLKALWQNKKVHVRKAAALYAETKHLRLDVSKATTKLSWRPKLNAEEAFKWTVDWYKRYQGGMEIDKLTEEQITRYESIVNT